MKEQRTPNSSYTQAGALCFVGQESGIYEVQFFVGSSVVKSLPACSCKTLGATLSAAIKNVRNLRLFQPDTGHLTMRKNKFNPEHPGARS